MLKYSYHNLFISFTMSFKIDSFHKNVFLCIYPICVPHFLAANVSKYAFFAVNLIPHFKHLVGFLVHFVFHRMYLVFCFAFVSRCFNTAWQSFIFWPNFLVQGSRLMMFWRAWWVLFTNFIITYSYSLKFVRFSS